MLSVKFCHIGGASGIGKGYATELAKEGFNIFIIDKSESDTANAKREIEKLGVKCVSLIYDFGMLGDSQEAEKLRLELEKYENAVVRLPLDDFL